MESDSPCYQPLNRQLSFFIDLRKECDVVTSTIMAQRLRYAAPSLMTSVGIWGMLGTNVLVGIGTYRATRIIVQDELENPETRPDGGRELAKHNAKLVWKEYIPGALFGAMTMGSLIGGIKLTNSRTAILAAAYAEAEKAQRRYREEVINKIGAHTEGEIQDKIREERVRSVQRELPIPEEGRVRCLELYTGRYFMSSMEELRKAQNDANHEAINTLYGTLDDFYNSLGLPTTSGSGKLGWNSDRLLELEFTTILSDDGVPTLAFDYNYLRPI